jgi:hypothetical protein
MTTKLTLKLKQSTVERGKRYARKRKTSLSKIVEGYLDRITEPPEDFSISPLVKSLSGLITPPKKNYRKDYINHLSKKYQ